MVNDERSTERERHEICIDGARGEGGGQILRTSLAASLYLQRPVRIDNIRARRSKPGLRQQHLVAIEAAARICGATVTGAWAGSTEIRFAPGPLSGGEHVFDIGSAGSTTLVLQTLLPALLGAAGPSRITVHGGTHNPLAPPFEFFDLAYLPLLRRMGARVTATLERHGFMPEGGGAIRLDVSPVSDLRPLHIVQRGQPVSLEGRIKIANLPRHIADREKRILRAQSSFAAVNVRIEQVDANGPGNAVILVARFGDVTEVFVAFGRPRLPAERVARAAADEARRYLESAAAVGPHLADQLLLPLALAGGGSFTTLSPTLHTTTQAKLVERLFGLPVTLQPLDKGLWQVTVGTDNLLPALVD